MRKLLGFCIVVAACAPAPAHQPVDGAGPVAVADAGSASAGGPADAGTVATGPAADAGTAAPPDAGAEASLTISVEPAASADCPRTFPATMPAPEQSAIPSLGLATGNGGLLEPDGAGHVAAWNGTASGDPYDESFDVYAGGSLLFSQGGDRMSGFAARPGGFLYGWNALASWPNGRVVQCRFVFGWQSGAFALCGTSLVRYDDELTQLGAAEVPAGTSLIAADALDHLLVGTGSGLHWIDAAGAPLSPDFQPPGHFGQIEPIVGGGLYSRVARVVLPSGGTEPQTAPDWFPRGNDRLSAIAGGTMSALTHVQQQSPCVERTELRDPAGTFCGALTFTSAASSCVDPAVAIGPDGTLVHTSPDGSYSVWRALLR